MLTQLRIDTRPDGVAVLTFDQPGSKANVLTAPMWADFEAALDSLAGGRGVLGLVLASAKPGIFIAGADLKLLGDAPTPNDPAVRAFIDHGQRVLGKLEALPFPTCAAIDGAALGGGLEVALACDFRLVGTSPKVKLGLPEVTLGLIPGWGGSQRLPRIAGVEHAIEMILCATNADAETAVNRGLASKAVLSEALVDEAAKLLLAASDWPAVRAAKQGPVPAEPFESADVLKPGGMNRARWNQMLLNETFFDGHRHYVNSQMADSLTRDASLAAIDVLERGAALPLAEAIPLETEAFMRLTGSEPAKALIAGFFAGRKK